MLQIIFTVFFNGANITERLDRPADILSKLDKKVIKFKPIFFW